MFLPAICLITSVRMIQDVIINPINTFNDERGWLKEIYRKDVHRFEAAMSYISFTKSHIVRGPHEHREQADFFIFVGPGDFELHLWDNRKKSKTFGAFMKIVVGESNPSSVYVPAGVVHGYKSVSPNGGICINLPDTLYRGLNKNDQVDEIRHEDDPTSKFKIE